MCRRVHHSALRLLAIGLGVCAVVAGPELTRASIENDDCQNATPITDGTHQGTTVGALLEGDPVCSGLCGCWPESGQAPDVWYLYTATCDGLLEVDTCGSEPFDSWLSIHEPGPDCPGSELACNEDACGPSEAPYQSAVVTEVAAGEQYLIRVSGWDQEVGDFELHVSCTAFGSPWEPGADHCEDAVELDVPSLVRGTTVGASGDKRDYWTRRGFPRTEGNWGCGVDDSFDQDFPSVWYRVKGTGNRMTASLEHQGTTSFHGVLVYCDACETPICVMGGANYNVPGKDSDWPWVSWCSRAGETYLLLVLAGEIGNFELSVSDDGTPCYGAVDCTPVEVIDTFLDDNGDADGWADTHETVEMGFSVANRSGRDVTGLVARLSSDDPKIACTAGEAIHIGDLAAGETRVAPGAFRFRVADTERASEHDDLTAEVRVSFASDQFEDLDPRRCSLTGVECEDHADCTGTEICAERRCVISGVPCVWNTDCEALEAGDYCAGRCSRSGIACIPEWDWACDTEVDFCVEEAQRVWLDLDLDAAGGAGPTEFFESFEPRRAASFDEMNLDAGLASLEASDGYRCAYADPETFGDAASLGVCYLGANPVHGDLYYWQTDDGRAYSGEHSLYMGQELAPGTYTTPVGSLEAAAITEPINLAAGRLCSGPTGEACLADGDCEPGERCLAVVPELSFKQQVSFIDDRRINTQGQASATQGVVQVQVVDEAGEPVGPWQTIEPKINRYDSVPSIHYNTCYFDPIDDGNDEDDLFDYVVADPPVGLPRMRYISVGGWYATHFLGSNLRFGPSSNCFPRHVFASAGDTDEPFDPTNLNGPAVGPGLEGATGPGTWVEPVFSLDRFRGRRIRIRFLASSLKWGFFEHYFQWLGELRSWDDGWWIDDVRVTHALVEPATVTADAKDNSALAHDGDGDCVADTADCMAGGAGTWALPGEVLDLHLDHAAGTSTLWWGPPTTMGATAVDYVVITEADASCAESSAGTDRTTTDSIDPAPGSLKTYLIQAENGCGRGPLGTDSTGTPRQSCR